MHRVVELLAVVAGRRGGYQVPESAFILNVSLNPGSECGYQRGQRRRRLIFTEAELRAELPDGRSALRVLIA
jgi:hypothetical protein